MQAASELVNRGRAADAVTAFAAYLNRTGPVADTIACLGFAARMGGDFELAWRSYRPAFELGLVTDEYAFGFGVAAVRTGRLDDAERAFLRAKSLYPGTEDALLALGIVRLRRALDLVRSDPARAAVVLEGAIADCRRSSASRDLLKLTAILHAGLALARLGAGRAADADAERNLAAAVLPDILPMTARDLYGALVQFEAVECERIGVDAGSRRPPQ
jgi:tetratricopeptide (TPR) repeat protein